MIRQSLSYWIIIVCVIALFSTASAEELIDPGKMMLRVTKVETMNTKVACYSVKKGKSYMAPKAGWKGIIVTVEGKISARGLLVLDPSAFFAIYDDLMSPGKVRLSHASAMCLSAITGKKMFIYAKDGAYFQKVLDPGPFTTRLLFYIPNSVKEFQVAYPTLIHGLVKTTE
jgi:hypothetical protein